MSTIHDREPASPPQDSTRSRARHRSRHRTPRPPSALSRGFEDEPENPLARLTPEQIEQLGREFDAIHDEVFAELGDRDSRYIRAHDQAAPPARAGRPRDAARLALQAAVAGRHGVAVGGEDPREHGDRPQRDARPVGLDERPRHQLPELGLGHRLARRRVASLAQLRAPHVHEHPRQGPRPGLRDHAHRPASEMASGVSVAAPLQPAADGVLRVGGGAARPQLRRDPRRREVQGAGRSRS